MINTSAYRFFMRRVVFVEDWFDDDHELPWNFIQRTGDGRFEAIASHIVDEAMEETSLGIFDEASEALKVLRNYVRTELALMRLHLASLDFGELFKDVDFSDCLKGEV